MKPIKRAQKRCNAGRKKEFIPDATILAKVEELSRNGLKQYQIMQYYGIGSNLWYSRCNEYPDLKIAYDRGRVTTTAWVGNRLLDKIKQGNVDAMKFYLKTRGEWFEASDPEQAQQDAEKPELTINVNDPIEAARIYQKIMRGDLDE